MAKINIKINANDGAFRDAQVEEIKPPLLTGKCKISKFRLLDLEVFGFTETIVPNALLRLAPMFLPSYLDEIGPRPGQGIKGLFMLDIKDIKMQNEADPLRWLHSGSFACYRVIFTDDSEKPKALHFNEMKFYPMLNIDHTVGFYVCDAKSKLNWDDPKGIDVAVNYPVTFDHTLGLYITRSATLEKREVND